MKQALGQSGPSMVHAAAAAGRVASDRGRRQVETRWHDTKLNDRRRTEWQQEWQTLHVLPDAGACAG